ncbi:hypothetical protein GG344DRAFT_65159 [Lentinula edodes]|nr:hypothetical protein GG344DRAFT_65159 [Lentinula edodes]
MSNNPYGELSTMEVRQHQQNNPKLNFKASTTSHTGSGWGQRPGRRRLLEAHISEISGATITDSNPTTPDQGGTRVFCEINWCRPPPCANFDLPATATWHQNFGVLMHVLENKENEGVLDGAHCRQMNGIKTADASRCRQLEVHTGGSAPVDFTENSAARPLLQTAPYRSQPSACGSKSRRRTEMVPAQALGITALSIAAAPGAVRTKPTPQRYSPISPPKTPPKAFSQVVKLEPQLMNITIIRERRNQKGPPTIIQSTSKYGSVNQAHAHMETWALNFGGRGYRSMLLSDGKWKTTQLTYKPSDGITLGSVVLTNESKEALFKLLDTAKLPDQPNLLFLDYLLTRVQNYPMPAKDRDLDLTMKGLWLQYMRDLLFQGGDGIGGRVTSKVQEQKYLGILNEPRFELQQLRNSPEWEEAEKEIQREYGDSARL